MRSVQVLTSFGPFLVMIECSSWVQIRVIDLLGLLLLFTGRKAIADILLGLLVMMVV